MKTLRRIIFTLALLTIAVCGGLLVTNFDPTNPTYRRYSSEVVIINGDDQKLKGDSAEIVLSKDLSVIRNDSKEGTKACFCHREEAQNTTTTEARCRSCLTKLPLSEANHRIPDFVTDYFIADSKNHAQMSTLDAQLQDFVNGANKLKRPLWIYVRVDTEVSQRIEDAVASTGGRVVYYFKSIENYYDATDDLLGKGIVGSSVVIVFIIFSGLVPKLFAFILPTPKSSVVVPEHKASRKARKAVDDYDDFMRNAGDSARKTLDD